MFETAFKSDAKEIAEYLLDQGASRILFLQGLEELPEQRLWLDLLRKHGPAIISSDTAYEKECLASYLESFIGHDLIIQYLKEEGVGLSPHWYNDSWKEDRSLMKKLSGNYKWKEIASLWPYLSESEKDQDRIIISGSMESYVGYWQKKGEIPASENDDFNRLKIMMNKDLVE
jgi:hypothetical protein